MSHSHAEIERLQLDLADAVHVALRSREPELRQEAKRLGRGLYNDLQTALLVHLAEHHPDAEIPEGKISPEYHEELHVDDLP